MSKTKSIGSGSDPESRARSQSDDYGGWCLELRLGEEDKSGKDLLKSSVLSLE